jgi:CheY-like chemotaxis protein
MAVNVNDEEPVKSYSGQILLADDHDDNRRLVTRLLERLGLEVITAKNGKEAIEQFLVTQPQLILLDIQMPEMDGIEAFKILKQKGCTAPIIALTANAMAHEVDQYATLGFDGYLKKPIERTLFINTIAKYCGTIKEIEEVESRLASIDMSDLVAQFKSNLVLEQQDLLLLLKHNDLQKLSQLAHRIAGAAQMFGFALLSEKAIALESVIKENDAEQVNDIAQHMLNEIDQVLW